MFYARPYVLMPASSLVLSDRRSIERALMTWKEGVNSRLDIWTVLLSPKIESPRYCLAGSADIWRDSQEVLPESAVRIGRGIFDMHHAAAMIFKQSGFALRQHCFQLIAFSHISTQPNSDAYFGCSHG